MVRLSPSWSYPKPMQRPHPPILLGGESNYTLRRVVDYCDGWFPRAGRGFEPAELMARLRGIADEVGRDMATLQVSLFRAPPDAAGLAAAREAGIDRAIFGLPSGDRDTVLGLLDDYELLLA